MKRHSLDTSVCGTLCLEAKLIFRVQQKIRRSTYIKQVYKTKYFDAKIIRNSSISLTNFSMMGILFLDIIFAMFW